MNETKIRFYAGFGFVLSLFCFGIASHVFASGSMSEPLAQPAQPRKYVVNDYDGDGISDLAIYDESRGLVSIYSLTNGLICNNVSIGGPGWMPFPGDFNGDAYCDLAMYNYMSGDWRIIVNRTWQTITGQMGGAGFIPAIADYDGDGVSDIGVYNVFTARWYVCSPTKGALYWDIQFGEPYPDPQFDPHLDFPSIPIAADLDGDGKADLALYMNKFNNGDFQTTPPGWWCLFSRTKTASYFLAAEYDYANLWDSFPVLLDNNGDGVFDLSAGPDNNMLTGNYNGDEKREIAYYSSYEDEYESPHWYIYEPWTETETNWWSKTVIFGGPTFIPVREICSEYDKCIWGNNLYNFSLDGTHCKPDRTCEDTCEDARLGICNHKVYVSCPNPDYVCHGPLYIYYSGGILGDEIWMMSDETDQYNAGDVSRGSLLNNPNPIIIYDYSNGEKTGGYWEFYR